MENNIIEKIINLVFASERRMPAHFTSDGVREQTFLVKFDDLSADDEYEMASQVWYKQPDITSDKDRNACVKIAEDIMIGCFILTKLDYKDECDYFITEMTDFNISQFPKEMHEELTQTCELANVKAYFDFCKKFGIEMAEKKKEPMQKDSPKKTYGRRISSEEFQKKHYPNGLPTFVTLVPKKQDKNKKEELKPLVNKTTEKEFEEETKKLDKYSQQHPEALIKYLKDAGQIEED